MWFSSDGCRTRMKTRLKQIFQAYLWPTIPWSCMNDWHCAFIPRTHQSHKKTRWSAVRMIIIYSKLGFIFQLKIPPNQQKNHIFLSLIHCMIHWVNKVSRTSVAVFSLCLGRTLWPQLCLNLIQAGPQGSWQSFPTCLQVSKPCGAVLMAYYASG